MPTINIREIDSTKAGTNAYSNFTVVVPGFFKTPDAGSIVGEIPLFNSEVTAGPTTRNIPERCSLVYRDTNESVFDENGIYECSSQSEFEKVIGKVAPVIANSEHTKKTAASPTPNYITHYGNQMAYELLGLGYTVLYKNMGPVPTEKNKEYYYSSTTAPKNAVVATEEILNHTVENTGWWEPLKDKAIYDFRYVVNGCLENNLNANNAICALAEHNDAVGASESGRGDCIALVDIDETKYIAEKSQEKIVTAVQTEVQAINNADKYSAVFMPSVYYLLKPDQAFGNNTKFPAVFHYLACASTAARNNFSEWFAVAGYARGISSNFSIAKTSVTLGDVAVNKLTPRQKQDSFSKSVNVIAKMKNGYYLWGNRTAYALTDKDLVASHFLNIRQLCTTIKKQAYITCHSYTFDPNSDVLWFNIKSTLTPVLDFMKANQGIRDYRIIRKQTDKKATLKMLIRIIPIEAVEDFDITLSLEDSFDSPDIQESEN